METSSNKSYSMHGKDLNSSNCYFTQRPELVATRKLTRMTGCLEIIDGENSGSYKSSQDSPSNSSRPSSSASIRPCSQVSVSCAAPRTDSSMNRRVNTPSKQISLQAVRRKEESTELFVDQVDWQTFGLNSNHRKTWQLGSNTADKKPTKVLVHKDSFKLESVVDTSQHAIQIFLPKQNNSEKENTTQIKPYSDSSDVKGDRESEMGIRDKNRNERSDEDDEDDGSDDEGSDSSDEEEEKLRAPNELLMEFVDCLMRKDYQTAKKLCKMILLYEPENPEALKFQPLIEEKLTLDAEAKTEADESDDDDDDDDSDSEDESDDDDSNDDSSNDEDSSSSEDDSPDEDDGDEKSRNNNNNNTLQFDSKERHWHY